MKSEVDVICEVESVRHKSARWKMKYVVEVRQDIINTIISY